MSEISSAKNITNLRGNENNTEYDWWEDFEKQNFPHEACIKYFKCSRKTFAYFIEALPPHVESKVPTKCYNKTQLNNTHSREGIAVEKQVGLFFYKLVNNVEYSVMSKIFKVHKASIHKSFYKCTIAMNKYLMYEHIKTPDTLEAERIARDFQMLHQIPQIMGVFINIHIPVESPLRLNSQFLNSKLYPSFILQALIDGNCILRDISIRHTGATELHTVLQESNIYKYAQKVLPTDPKTINGIEVPFKIVSPPGGPHASWLLADYIDPSDPLQLAFNEHLQDMRNYADSVIARLRTRFLILSQPIDLNYTMVPQVIAACCIIHNFCEIENDPFYEKWLLNHLELIKKYPQPEDKCTYKWENPEDIILKQRDAIKDTLIIS